MSETQKQDGEPTTDSSRDKLVEYLPTALTAVTTALAAIGGLTGGIARMLRNNPALSLITLLAAVAAILAALLAQYWRGRPRVFRTLIIASIALFIGAVALGCWLAVDTVGERDRPGLTAKLTQNDAGAWSIEGTAAASGLAARDSLQVFIYAIPPNETQPRPKLYFVTAGPNADGTASQTFSVPLPDKRNVRSIVVTAAVGDYPRWCDGTALDVSAGLNVSSQDEPVEGKNACIVVLPPQ
jgi:hypothetical protein